MREWGAVTPGSVPLTPNSLLLALILAMPLVLAGCVSGDDGGARHTVRDSAGIQIIVYDGAGGCWSSNEVRHLSSRPAVEIGSVGGAPETQLYRVTDAVRLSDGRIVVANSGTGELRYFDASGEFLFAAGGAGNGPGEFSQGAWSGGLSELGRAGADTVLAYDQVSHRISVFGPDGSYIRSTTLESPGEDLSYRITAVGWMDKTFVGHTSRPSDGRTIMPGDKIRRFTHALVFYGADGEFMQATGRFPGDEAYISIGSLSASGTFSVAATTVPFLKKLIVSTGANTIAVGATDTYQIWLYGSDAKLRRIIRAIGKSRPVTQEAVEAWIIEKLSDIQDRTRIRERRRDLETLPYPEAMPAFASLAIDANGRLWVEEYASPGTRGPAIWTVFDRQGRCLRQFEIPRGFTIYEIGDDYVLGLREDDLGVEHVQLYRLEEQ